MKKLFYILIALACVTSAFSQGEKQSAYPTTTSVAGTDFIPYLQFTSPSTYANKKITWQNVLNSGLQLNSVTINGSSSIVGGTAITVTGTWPNQTIAFNVTLPSGAIVGTTDTQTLTNKTLQGATLTSTTTIAGSVATSGSRVISIGSGSSIQFLSGSGLIIAGQLDGTPTGGTLDLSGISLTLANTFTTNSGTQTITNKTLSLNSNTVSLTLPDSGSVSQLVAAIFAGNVVLPQQFGAVGDNSHDDTSAFQSALDTGRSVFAPEGIYKITSALDKRSIGQYFLGAGVNRTIISQVTNNADAVDIRDPNGDGNAAHQWRGAYNGGDGSYYQEIGEMSIQSTNASTTGKAINIIGPTPGSHSGDFVYIHDVFGFQWNYHIYDDSLAMLHVSRCVFQNASSLGAAFGTGIYTTGANPNSNVFEAVTLSGLTTGLDLLCGGTKINAGDVGQCTTGIQIRGGDASIIGGHMESCARYLSIGSTEPALVSVDGLDVLADSMSTTNNFKVNNGSLLTGTISGSAPHSGTPLVECVTESDHAYLINIATASDNGTAAPENFQFRNDAIGKTYRFPTIDLIKQNNSLPTAGASFLGKIFMIANGSGLGSGRLVMEYEDNSGAYHWSDLFNDTLLNSNQTVSSTWTFSTALVVSGELQATNGFLGAPAGAAGGAYFGDDSSGDGYFMEFKASGGSLGGVTPSGSLFLTSGYLYCPRDGNATAGCLQSDGWTLYSPASNQLGVGFNGTQGLLVTATTLVASGTVRTGGYTVSTLPTGVTGARAYVTDALTPTFLTTIVGGGTTVCPVFYNGTNWVAY